MDKGKHVGTQVLADGGLTWDLNVRSVETAKSSAETEKEGTKKAPEGAQRVCGTSVRELERETTLNK